MNSESEHFLEEVKPPDVTDQLGLAPGALSDRSMSSHSVTSERSTSLPDIKSPQSPPRGTQHQSSRSQEGISPSTSYGATNVPGPPESFSPHTYRHETNVDSNYTRHFARPSSVSSDVSSERTLLHGGLGQHDGSKVGSCSSAPPLTIHGSPSIASLPSSSFEGLFPLVLNKKDSSASTRGKHYGSRTAKLIRWILPPTKAGRLKRFIGLALLFMLCSFVLNAILVGLGMFISLRLTHLEPEEMIFPDLCASSDIPFYFRGSIYSPSFVNMKFTSLNISVVVPSITAERSIWSTSLTDWTLRGFNRPSLFVTNSVISLNKNYSIPPLMSIGQQWTFDVLIDYEIDLRPFWIPFTYAGREEMRNTTMNTLGESIPFEISEFRFLTQGKDFLSAMISINVGSALPSWLKISIPSVEADIAIDSESNNAESDGGLRLLGASKRMNGMETLSNITIHPYVLGSEDDSHLKIEVSVANSSFPAIGRLVDAYREKRPQKLAMFASNNSSSKGCFLKEWLEESGIHYTLLPRNTSTFMLHTEKKADSNQEALERSEHMASMLRNVENSRKKQPNHANASQELFLGDTLDEEEGFDEDQILAKEAFWSNQQANANSENPILHIHLDKMTPAVRSASNTLEDVITLHFDVKLRSDFLGTLLPDRAIKLCGVIPPIGFKAFVNIDELAADVLLTYNSDKAAIHSLFNGTDDRPRNDTIRPHSILPPHIIHLLKNSAYAEPSVATFDLALKEDNVEGNCESTHLNFEAKLTLKSSGLFASLLHCILRFPPLFSSPASSVPFDLASIIGSTYRLARDLPLELLRLSHNHLIHLDHVGELFVKGLGDLSLLSRVLSLFTVSFSLHDLKNIRLLGFEDDFLFSSKEVVESKAVTGGPVTAKLLRSPSYRRSKLIHYIRHKLKCRFDTTSYAFSFLGDMHFPENPAFPGEIIALSWNPVVAELFFPTPPVLGETQMSNFADTIGPGPLATESSTADLRMDYSKLMQFSLSAGSLHLSMVSQPIPIIAHNGSISFNATYDSGKVVSLASDSVTSTQFRETAAKVPSEESGRPIEEYHERHAMKRLAYLSSILSDPSGSISAVMRTSIKAGPDSAASLLQRSPFLYIPLHLPVRAWKQGSGIKKDSIYTFFTSEKIHWVGWEQSMLHFFYPLSSHSTSRSPVQQHEAPRNDSTPTHENATRMGPQFLGPIEPIRRLSVDIEVAIPHLTLNIGSIPFSVLSDRPVPLHELYVWEKNAVCQVVIPPLSVQVSAVDGEIGTLTVEPTFGERAEIDPHTGGTSQVITFYSSSASSMAALKNIIPITVANINLEVAPFIVQDFTSNVPSSYVSFYHPSDAPCKVYKSCSFPSVKDTPPPNTEPNIESPGTAEGDGSYYNVISLLSQPPSMYSKFIMAVGSILLEPFHPSAVTRMALRSIYSVPKIPIDRWLERGGGMSCKFGISSKDASSVTLDVDISLPFVSMKKPHHTGGSSPNSTYSTGSRKHPSSSSFHMPLNMEWNAIWICLQQQPNSHPNLGPSDICLVELFLSPGKLRFRRRRVQSELQDGMEYMDELDFHTDGDMHDDAKASSGGRKERPISTELSAKLTLRSPRMYPLNSKASASADPDDVHAIPTATSAKLKTYLKNILTLMQEESVMNPSQLSILSGLVLRVAMFDCPYKASCQMPLPYDLPAANNQPSSPSLDSAANNNFIPTSKLNLDPETLRVILRSLYRMATPGRSTTGLKSTLLDTFHFSAILKPRSTRPSHPFIYDKAMHSSHRKVGQIPYSIESAALENIQIPCILAAACPMQPVPFDFHAPPTHLQVNGTMQLPSVVKPPLFSFDLEVKAFLQTVVDKLAMLLQACLARLVLPIYPSFFEYSLDLKDPLALYLQFSGVDTFLVGVPPIQFTRSTPLHYGVKQDQLEQIEAERYEQASKNDSFTIHVDSLLSHNYPLLWDFLSPLWISSDFPQRGIRLKHGNLGIQIPRNSAGSSSEDFIADPSGHIFPMVNCVGLSTDGVRDANLASIFVSSIIPDYDSRSSNTGSDADSLLGPTSEGMEVLSTSSHHLEIGMGLYLHHGLDGFIVDFTGDGSHSKVPMLIELRRQGVMIGTVSLLEGRFPSSKTPVYVKICLNATTEIGRERLCDFITSHFMVSEVNVDVSLVVASVWNMTMSLTLPSDYLPPGMVKSGYPSFRKGVSSLVFEQELKLSLPVYFTTTYPFQLMHYYWNFGISVVSDHALHEARINGVDPPRLQLDMVKYNETGRCVPQVIDGGLSPYEHPDTSAKKMVSCMHEPDAQPFVSLPAVAPGEQSMAVVMMDVTHDKLGKMDLLKLMNIFTRDVESICLQSLGNVVVGLRRRSEDDPFIMDMDHLKIPMPWSGVDPCNQNFLCTPVNDRLVPSKMAKRAVGLFGPSLKDVLADKSNSLPISDGSLLNKIPIRLNRSFRVHFALSRDVSQDYFQGTLAINNEILRLSFLRNIYDDYGTISLEWYFARNIVKKKLQRVLNPIALIVNNEEWSNSTSRAIRIESVPTSDIKEEKVPFILEYDGRSNILKLTGTHPATQVPLHSQFHIDLVKELNRDAPALYATPNSDVANLHNENSAASASPTAYLSFGVDNDIPGFKLHDFHLHYITPDWSKGSVLYSKASPASVLESYLYFYHVLDSCEDPVPFVGIDYVWKFYIFHATRFYRQDYGFLSHPDDVTPEPYLVPYYIVRMHDIGRSERFIKKGFIPFMFSGSASGLYYVRACRTLRVDPLFPDEEESITCGMAGLIYIKP